MKEKTNKKGHENIIGKIIYGFLLFMPLLAIGSTLLISTFNNQAKQESEIHYRYETNEVNTINDLQLNKLYHLDYLSCEDFNTNNESYYGNNIEIYIVKAETIEGTMDGPYLDEQSINNYESNKNNCITLSFGIISENYVTVQYAYFSNDNGYVSIGDMYDNTFIIYNIDFYIIDNTSSNLFKSLLNRLPTKSNYNVIDYVETHNIDAKDLFYDSIAKVEQSEYFNWTTNTAIYSGVETSTTLLGITTTFVPFILTYWLIITVAYLIYDIALMLLLMTHRKIHEIQESI